MKKLLKFLFVASFAALPLFATEEPQPPVEKPTDEVTLDDIKESEDLGTEEITILDIEEKEETAS